MADLVRLIARVPPELRDAVKVEAARSRRSVQSIVIQALEDWFRAPWDVVASIEWAGDGAGNQCPDCRGWRDEGHGPECRLRSGLLAWRAYRARD